MTLKSSSNVIVIVIATILSILAIIIKALVSISLLVLMNRLLINYLTGYVAQMLTN